MKTIKITAYLLFLFGGLYASIMMFNLVHAWGGIFLGIFVLLVSFHPKTLKYIFNLKNNL